MGFGIAFNGIANLIHSIDTKAHTKGISEIIDTVYLMGGITWRGYETLYAIMDGMNVNAME